MAASKFAHTLITAVAILGVSRAIAADNNSKPAIVDFTRPLSFEPNRGQTDERVEFLARGSAYRLFLSHGGATLALKNGIAVRMRLAGATASTLPEPLDPQPSRSNYFIGNVPERWRMDIPNYAKVRYRNVYPGIDLIYYGNQRQLEYDLVVAPGTDPRKITLWFQGAAKTELDRSGDLVMHTPAGELRWHKPVAYQNVNGTRNLVACDYVRKGGQLGFRLAAYDRNKPLIIDPELEYSTYLGGSGFDQGSGIAVDTEGNAYVTGFTFSIDFPTKNAFQDSENGFKLGWANAFITKFNRSGELIYSTYLGGSGQDCMGEGNCGGNDGGNAIAVDSDGGAYVTGVTFSFDFPIKNAFQTALNAVSCESNLTPCSNAFVTELSADGKSLVFSTYLGGSGTSNGGSSSGDQGDAIAVDVHGNAYVTGNTNSLDFPITENAFQKELKSSGNAFVTKFEAGGKLAYSTFLGGSGGDQGYGIAVDLRGNAYVGGGTSSSDFPITKDAFQTKLKGPINAFVTKLDNDGDSLIYSTYIGGSGENGVAGIAVDRHGRAYVTGGTNSADFPIKGAFQKNLNGSVNAFVTKLDVDGDSLIYSTYLGGSGEDSGAGIALDKHEDAYVVGSTNSSNFPTTKNAYQGKPKNPYGSAFVTKISAQ